MKEWKYYNHAVIPAIAPHLVPDLTIVKNKSVFKRAVCMGRTVALVQWTTDWDCKDKTDWWYVIKDKPFDISKLKSKRRYEVNKGIKNFDVNVINPMDYTEDIYRVTKEAYSAWPEKYRPTVNYERVQKSIESWKNQTVFAGFAKESKELMGYAILKEFDSYIEFSILRTVPTCEKLGINAAIVAGILYFYEDRLEKGIYK